MLDTAWTHSSSFRKPSHGDESLQMLSILWSHELLFGETQNTNSEVGGSFEIVVICAILCFINSSLLTH